MLISRSESAKHSIQPIDKAYSNALNEAKNSIDMTLEDKKKLIIEHMNANKEKY